MIKRSIIFLILIALVLQLKADENEKENLSFLKPTIQADLSFSGLGFSGNIPLSQAILFEVGAGLGAGYRINEDFKYYLYLDNPAVYANLHAKYYYELKKNRAKDRNRKFNSGNFAGLQVQYTSPNISEQVAWNTLLTSVHWGMQRQLYKRFVMQLTLGVGVAMNLDFSETTNVSLFPDVNFKISYVLPLGKK